MAVAIKIRISSGSSRNTVSMDTALVGTIHPPAAIQVGNSGFADVQIVGLTWIGRRSHVGLLSEPLCLGGVLLVGEPGRLGHCIVNADLHAIGKEARP